jgi:hypothetical protein
MKQRFGVSATLVFGVVLGFPRVVRAATLSDSTDGLTITVKVHNFAKVPRTTLEKSQAVASGVFRETGVELKWLNCPCQTEAATFSLRVIPKLFGSTQSTFRSDHLGFAAVSDDGGDLATVFFDRVEALGKGGDLSHLLGLATTHELGHLLLGPGAHVDEGIMRPHWTRKDLRQVHRRSFRFSPEQSQTMRHRLGKSRAAKGLATESERPGPIENAGR